MHNEKVFTPEWMVKLMLDKVGYKNPSDILLRHIIDNSCGKGAFLTEVVRRYCQFFKYNIFNSTSELKEELSTYIHGIEIDMECYEETIRNLDKVASEYGVTDVEWDIINGNTLTEGVEYYKNMDYVVGNPPYVNVHDFGDNYDIIKSFSFTSDGMADTYLAFFEAGINMLSENGKLIYITPSSWTSSLAGKTFRKYLIDNNKLSDVIVLGHEKVFPNSTTFTMITEINNGKEDDEGITLYRFNSKNRDIDYIATRPLKTFTVNNCFYFTNNLSTVSLMREIEKHEYKETVKVKNGFATLNDKLFVIDEDLSEKDSRYWIKDLIPVVKASTGEIKWMVFPYDLENDLKPLQFNELNPYTQEFLLNRAKELKMEEHGKMEGQWWLYGRSQAIKDYGTWKRYSVNNLIRNKSDIKIKPLYHFYGVYSGFYITIVDKNCKYIDFEKLLSTDEFENYVKTIGKYKNGGYYTFNTKELENYINYKIWEANT